MFWYVNKTNVIRECVIFVMLSRNIIYLDILSTSLIVTKHRNRSFNILMNGYLCIYLDATFSETKYVIKIYMILDSQLSFQFFVSIIFVCYKCLYIMHHYIYFTICTILWPNLVPKFINCSTLNLRHFVSSTNAFTC